MPTTASAACFSWLTRKPPSAWQTDTAFHLLQLHAYLAVPFQGGIIPSCILARKRQTGTGCLDLWSLSPPTRTRCTWCADDPLRSCRTQSGDYKVTSTGDQLSAFCKAAWMISARLTGVWALKVLVEPVEEVAAVPGDCES